MIDDDVIPAGRVVELSMAFVLPAAATKADILEWVRFELGGGGLRLDCPLIHHELEAIREPTLTDTGRRYRERREDIGSGRQRIYRWTEPDGRSA